MSNGTGSRWTALTNSKPFNCQKQPTSQGPPWLHHCIYYFASKQEQSYMFKERNRTNLLFFSNFAQFTKEVFLCLRVLTQRSKIPTYSILFSPTLKSLLVGVDNSNKEGLKAVPIYPYLKHTVRMIKMSSRYIIKALPKRTVKQALEISISFLTQEKILHFAFSLLYNRTQTQPWIGSPIVGLSPHVPCRLEKKRGQNILIEEEDLLKQLSLRMVPSVNPFPSFAEGQIFSSLFRSSRLMALFRNLQPHSKLKFRLKSENRLLTFQIEFSRGLEDH